MPTMSSLSASLEDYLEAILRIISQKGAAKAKDIAKALKVNNSSVTGALKMLTQKGMINYAPYDVITLTETGRTLATDVARRHGSLKTFFGVVMAVPDEQADDLACKMEHMVTSDMLERFEALTSFMLACRKAGFDYSPEKGYFCPKQAVEVNTVPANDSGNREARLAGVTTLDQLLPGQKAKVLRLEARGNLAKRLREMGLIKDAEVEFIKTAPLADPQELLIKGYHVSLRKKEASHVHIEIQNP